jgi:hypothetical protein
MFPPCQEKPKPTPMYICRDECEILEDDVCKLELAIARRHHMIGKSIQMPECSQLPPIGSDDSCLRLGLPKAAIIREGTSTSIIEEYYLIN